MIGSTTPMARFDWMGGSLSVTVLMRHTVYLASGGIGLTLTRDEAIQHAAALRQARAAGADCCTTLTINGHRASLHTSVMGARLVLSSGPFLFAIDSAAAALLADCLDDAVRVIDGAVRHEEAACSTR